MSMNMKDVMSGLFFILAGLLYGGMAWTSLPMGEALNMGPGYFPLILSGVLVVLGVAIGTKSFRQPQQTPFGRVPWQGIVSLSLATILFAAFIEQLGLLPGVFLTTFVATLANPRVKLGRAVLTSFCIALFCTGVFAYGVSLPLPVIGKWLIW